MTEQEAFDEWCPAPYRQRIWTAQAEEAARAAFAAAWWLLSVPGRQYRTEWIDQNHQIDRYGVALMMIREGCADPAGLARRILAEFGASPPPQDRGRP